MRNLAFGLLILTGFFITLPSPSGASAETASSLDLLKQVDQLTQDCQNGENLTREQLQEVISRCAALRERVEQGTHPQKKLFMIRLKKSQNFCLYLLQIRQKE